MRTATSNHTLKLYYMTSTTTQSSPSALFNHAPYPTCYIQLLLGDEPVLDLIPPPAAITLRRPMRTLLDRCPDLVHLSLEARSTLHHIEPRDPYPFSSLLSSCIVPVTRVRSRKTHKELQAGLEPSTLSEGTEHGI
ncbi:hypothetical protein FA13DRAFT_1732430 [Coprinellus micaceus]|uniref:Uncharacterized protein n=1 Tax=Coprinellus micaceus TaxID=71717 RepID=A0A4Y7TBP8_COPMI|nr:hypothetical protein FA13DRAFT_1732430 [Coprinellus micaceus]